MKLRMAAVPAALGAFAVGYAVGTATGRRQARQLARLAGRAGRSAPVTGTATFVGGKTRAAARLTVEWLKDVAGTALGWRNGDDAADAIVVDLAEELAHVVNGHVHASGGAFGPTGTGGRQVRPPAAASDEAVRSHRALVQSSSR